MLDKNRTNEEAAVVEQTTGALDNIISNDQEREQVKSLVQKQMQNYKVEVVSNLQKEEKIGTDKTQPHRNIDSWLAKNIRPLTLIFILALYAIFSFGSGIDSIEDGTGEKVPWLHVPEDYVKLLGNWGMVIMSFYFGGRTFEKSYQHYASKKERAGTDRETMSQNENAAG